VVLAVCVTEIEALVAPVLQEYVLAPDAERLMFCPTHTVELDVMFTVGLAYTVTVCVAFDEHPVTSVPTTV
jgi:hypothetical protein